MITFSSVTKAFLPDSTGVFDVSFSIEPGEMVFITGPSGSGKTTLMRLLTREYEPTSGAIEFQGKALSDIREREIHHHRRKIGVVFQDYRLLPELNVWENIALPLYIIGKPQSEIEERVTDLLKLVQLTGKSEVFPRQLSGGEAQRISIARALAIAPTVICADEPTGNLDRDTATNIAHLLHTINKLGTTILFATHDPHIISLFADKRRINLEDGKITLDTHTSEPPKSPNNKKLIQAEEKKEIDTSKVIESKEKKPSFFARWFGSKKSESTDSKEKITKSAEHEEESKSGEEKEKSSNKKQQTTDKNPDKKSTLVTVKVESLDDEELA